jgi:hypothetical protein
MADIKNFVESEDGGFHSDTFPTFQVEHWTFNGVSYPRGQKEVEEYLLRMFVVLTNLTEAMKDKAYELNDDPYSLVNVFTILFWEMERATELRTLVQISQQKPRPSFEEAQVTLLSLFKAFEAMNIVLKKLHQAKCVANSTRVKV